MHEDADHQGDGEPSAIREVIVTVVAALALAWCVQAFLVKPFRIPSGSMENTLRCGDRVLVNRLGYRFGDPSRGDVVVFHPPAGQDSSGNPDPSTVLGEDGSGTSFRTNSKGDREITKADVNYIKRLIAKGGDTVEVRHQHVILNGKAIKEPYLRPLSKSAELDGSLADMKPYKVPKGTYFMLGDHRDNSADSRVWGPVPRSHVIGKAVWVYWPPSNFGGLPKEDPGGPDSTKQDPNCLESGLGTTDG
jgi:signal peptidase I